MSEFYNDIVENLKKEANFLNGKLSNFRDNHDMQGYISTIKALRETLELIHKYDWQLMYSEYEVFNDDGTKQKQISVWYGNHDKQIKDHKYWNVLDERIDVPNNI